MHAFILNKWENVGIYPTWSTHPLPPIQEPPVRKTEWWSFCILEGTSLTFTKIAIEIKMWEQGTPHPLMHMEKFPWCPRSLFFSKKKKSSNFYTYQKSPPLFCKVCVGTSERQKLLGNWHQVVGLGRPPFPPFLEKFPHFPACFKWERPLEAPNKNKWGWLTGQTARTTFWMFW